MPQVIGRYRSVDNARDYAAACSAKWALLDRPNTLIVLSVGDGLIERMAIDALKPRPEHTISIDPRVSPPGPWTHHQTYTEAGAHLAAIEEPRGMVIGVNLVLSPTDDESLDDMLGKIAVAKDWLAVVVRSPRMEISEMSLERLFDIAKSKHAFIVEKKQEEEAEMAKYRAEKEEREAARRRWHEDHVLDSEKRDPARADRRREYEAREKALRDKMEEKDREEAERRRRALKKKAKDKKKRGMKLLVHFNTQR